MFNRTGTPADILKFRFSEAKSKEVLCERCGNIIAYKNKRFYKVSSTLVPLKNISSIKCDKCGKKNHV